MPASGGSVVVQTEVTYAPSPRRIGKKKVKLNPIRSVIRNSGNRPQETDSPTKNYDIQSTSVLPVAQNDSEKNVIVIGGKLV